MIIKGTGFGQGATVKFGAASASSVVVVDAFTITCLTPAHAVGSVNVTVTNPDGQSATLTNGYRYSTTWVEPPSQEEELPTSPGSEWSLTDPLPPTPTSVAPNSGSSVGGEPIVIIGTSFVQGATATIGGNALINPVVVNSKGIYGLTPAHAIGTVDVVITNPDSQTGTLTNAYTYTNPLAIVTSITPIIGPTVGGTTLTIQGTGFIDPVIVTVGGLTATSPTVVNSQTVTAVTPAHAKGPAEVTVVNTA
jgi:hypothetical protein